MCVSKTKKAERKLSTEPVEIKCFVIFSPGLFRWYNRCNQNITSRTSLLFPNPFCMHCLFIFSITTHPLIIIILFTSLISSFPYLYAFCRPLLPVFLVLYVVSYFAFNLPALLFLILSKTLAPSILICYYCVSPYHIYVPLSFSLLLHQ